MRTWTACTAYTVLLLLCVCPRLLKGDADASFTQLGDDFFRWHKEQVPLYSTEVGDKKYNDRLADLGLDVFDSQRTAVQGFINRARGIDRSQLDRARRFSYDILLDMLNTFNDNYAWRFYAPVNPINFLDPGYLNLASLVDITPFDDKKDFDNYISRLEAWPRQISQEKDRMDKAIQQGTTYHNVSVMAVPNQISNVISTPAVSSPLYKPFTDTLNALSLSASDKEDLRTRGKAAIQDMWTALGQLKSYIEHTYMPNTRQTYGVYGLPSGRDYYRACLKWHLSQDLPPDQVHQTGLREVDRISQLMRKVMTKQGFSGTVAQYYAQLKADPQFSMNSADEVLRAYRDLINNRIKPKLPTLFKDIPPGQVVVQKSTTDGVYGMYQSGSADGKRPGIFYVNLFRPNETKTFSMVSLTLHETSPGHHLQGIYALAASLPDFQKNQDYYYGYSAPYMFPLYTAYVEGWALYAEYLGEEMGVYQNDYEMMGRYGDEIFRACRLVIDTGLHYKGWTRQQAIQYLADHTPMSLAEIEIEVDRYLTWPGQACAYKIGELKIRELRENATKELGDKFDIHDFHSLLLTHGPMPLAMMEKMVGDFVHEKLTGAAPTVQCVSASSVGLYLLLAALIWTVTHQ